MKKYLSIIVLGVILVFLSCSCATLQSLFTEKEQCIRDWQIYYHGNPVLFKMPCAIPNVDESEFSYSRLNWQLGMITLVVDKDKWCVLYVLLGEPKWVAVSCFSESKFTHWIPNEKSLPIKIDKEKLIEVLTEYLQGEIQEHLDGLKQKT